MTVAGIEAVAATEAAARMIGTQGAATASAGASPEAGSFARMLADGLAEVNRNLVDADVMVRQFAIDDNIPVHQVTFALEQARMSLELMMQVRSRLVDAYQQVMGMQI